MSTTLIQNYTQFRQDDKKRRKIQRQQSILQFVRNRGYHKANESQVVLHIKNLGLGTRETVRMELSLMKQRGMIKIQTNGKRGKAKVISIIEENELSDIHDRLIRVEKILKNMNEPFRREGQPPDILFSLSLNFTSRDIFRILSDLLKKTSELSDLKDSRIFTERTLDLIQILCFQSVNVMDEDYFELERRVKDLNLEDE